MTLEIGQGNRADTVRIAEISDRACILSTHGSRTMRVTVREMIGGYRSWIGGREKALTVMRNTAKQALPKGSVILNTARTAEHWDMAQMYATFEIRYIPKDAEPMIPDLPVGTPPLEDLPDPIVPGADDR